MSTDLLIVNSRMVADYHAAVRDTGLNPKDKDDMIALTNHTRNRSIVEHRRHIASYLRLLNYTLDEIGAMMGRDHTSIIDMLKPEQVDETDRRRQISYERIERMVLETLGVTREELIGVGRRPACVLARGCIAYLCRQFNMMSYPDIARAMGRPTHTTILAAVQRIASQIESMDCSVDIGPDRVTIDELVNRRFGVTLRTVNRETEAA